MKPIISFIILVVVFIAGMIIHLKVKKYEFENTTDGGVVQFKSYWHAEIHSGLRFLSFLATYFGGIAIILAIIIYFLG